jgi:CBS domain-containing protein
VEPSRDRVEPYIRKHYVAVEPGECVLEADRLMRMARLRQVPVTRNGILIGMLWHRDLLEGWVSRLREVPLQSVLDELGDFRVESVMRPNPEAVLPGDSLANAARTMLRLDMGCLPAVERTAEGPRMLGIVTERDLIQAAYLPGTGRGSHSA